MDFYRKLKIIRLQNNLKQQQVADVLGITRSAYCSYEIGRRAVDLETVVKLSRFYKLPIQVFLETEMTENMDDHTVYENEKDIRFLSQLSRDEVSLIVKYRMMSNDEKEEITSFAHSKIEK
jgi:transcriptional regulator with XRE-family HTH domain